MSKEKKSSIYPPHFWPALIIFSLTGQVAWVVENMYFNVFIYKMFQASAEQISTMMVRRPSCRTRMSFWWPLRWQWC